MSPASSQIIKAQLVDGDGDTAESTLTLHLQDEAVSFTVKAATGQEDQGAQDPSQGIAIDMRLDIGDFDRGERVDQLLIQAPANAHGTFYYHGWPSPPRPMASGSSCRRRPW